VLLEFQEDLKLKGLQISQMKFMEVCATGLFTEQTPISPNSPIRQAAASDMMVQAFYHTYVLPLLLPDVRTIMVLFNFQRN
jgi:dTDP-D-glucose 4,6-dehydratase